MFQKVLNKPPIEVGEAQEGLYLLLVCRSRPFGNASNLDWIHCNGVMGDDHSEILDCGLLKLALVRAEVELVLLQKLQNAAGDLPMLISVWKSGHRTRKRLGLDRTRTTQDRKSQDRKLQDRTGLQLQSGPRSFAISKIPGPHKDQSGPVRTSLCGRYILLISANNIL